MLASTLRSIHPAVPLPTLRNRIQIKSLSRTVLSVTAQGKTAAEAEGAANAVATSYVAFANESPPGAWRRP